jgi:hypothetical protein
LIPTENTQTTSEGAAPATPTPAVSPASALEGEARAIVEEESALLERVLGHLRTVTPPRAASTVNFEEQMLDLRDQIASGAPRGCPGARCSRWNALQGIAARRAEIVVGAG